MTSIGRTGKALAEVDGEGFTGGRRCAIVSQRPPSRSPPGERIELAPVRDVIAFR
jgi:hypothetical protein